MLVTERNENGRTIVRLHKDWHIGRLGCNYVPKNLIQSRDAERLQTALIRHYEPRPGSHLVALSNVELRLHTDPKPASKTGIKARIARILG